MPSTRDRAARKTPLNQDPAAVIRAREWAGLTRTQVAQATGKSLSLISEIETGSRNATPVVLQQIASVFNCPVSMLERKREAVA